MTKVTACFRDYTDMHQQNVQTQQHPNDFLLEMNTE